MKFSVQAARGVLALCLCLVLADAALAQSGNPYGGVRSVREDFVQHMSSRCRNLYDFISRSRSQGRLSEFEAQRVQEANREFDEYCRGEVQDAMEQTYKRRSQQRMEKADAIDTTRELSAQQQQEENRARQQCLESKRIIATKRERKDMTPGELQDLARFEENVNKRCPSSAAR